MSDKNIDIIQKYEYEESKYLKRQHKIITNQDKDNHDDDVLFEYNDIEKPPESVTKKDTSGPYMNESFMPSNDDSDDDIVLHPDNSNEVPSSNNCDIDIDDI